MQESEDIARFRAGFEGYYTSVLQPKFADIEAERKKYLRYFIIGLLIIFVVLPLICAGLLWWFLSSYQGNFDSNDFPMGTILFGFSIIIMIVSTPLVIFKRKAKGQVMPEFIRYFGEFNYQYQQFIDDATLATSRLFSGYNRHDGDDYFYGSYKGVGITVSEENLRFKQISSDGKRTSYAKIFKGIVVVLDMNKIFAGQTVVLKDYGLFNGFKKPRGLERIVLEDCVFEKEFEVYGTDQLEARYLLTTAFMERMLKVREAFKGNRIQFSFFNNKLLIAIDSKQDMFESTSIFRSTTDRRLINQTFEQIISIMAVIDVLKLAPR